MKESWLHIDVEFLIAKGFTIYSTPENRAKRKKWSYQCHDNQLVLWVDAFGALYLTDASKQDSTVLIALNPTRQDVENWLAFVRTFKTPYWRHVSSEWLMDVGFEKHTGTYQPEDPRSWWYQYEGEIQYLWVDAWGELYLGDNERCVESVKVKTNPTKEDIQDWIQFVRDDDD